MVFSTRRTQKTSLKLITDGKSIGEIQNTKFLGIIIDNKLNWKDHISSIAGRVSLGVGMIIKARNYLNRNGLMCLYYSFVWPYFIYCNHIWGSTYTSILRRLIVLQNKVLRIILHVEPRNNAKPFYKELNIMKFVNINKYLIGNFIHHYNCGKVPDIFSHFSIEIVISMSTIRELPITFILLPWKLI